MEDKSALIILSGVAAVGLLLTAGLFALNLAYADALYVTRLLAGLINCF